MSVDWPFSFDSSSASSGTSSLPGSSSFCLVSVHLNTNLSWEPNVWSGALHLELNATLASRMVESPKSCSSATWRQGGRPRVLGSAESLFSMDPGHSDVDLLLFFLRGLSSRAAHQKRFATKAISLEPKLPKRSKKLRLRKTQKDLKRFFLQSLALRGRSPRRSEVVKVRRPLSRRRYFTSMVSFTSFSSTKAMTSSADRTSLPSISKISSPMRSP